MPSLIDINALGLPEFHGRNPTKAVVDIILNNDSIIDAAAIESLYAEDAVVYLNSLDSIPIQENVKNLAMHHELFDDISLSWGDGENARTAFVQTSSYPTIDVTLAWFTWTGTGKASGKTYNVPTHVVYFWGEDGKVASSSLFNDSASFTEEMNAVAASSE